MIFFCSKKNEDKDLTNLRVNNVNIIFKPYIINKIPYVDGKSYLTDTFLFYFHHAFMVLHSYNFFLYFIFIHFFLLLPLLQAKYIVAPHTISLLP